MIGNKTTLINVKSEINQMSEWAHRLNNPEITHQNKVLGKKTTRYEKWSQWLDCEKSTESNIYKIFIGRQAKNIHCLQHIAVFTDLTIENAKKLINKINLKIKMTEGELLLFSFTFDEYIAIMNLLNIYKNQFYIPFQYILFGKQIFHSSYEHFSGFICELELIGSNIHTNLQRSMFFSSNVSGLCITLSEDELKIRAYFSSGYYINKYVKLSESSSKPNLSISLNYCQPIRSIVAFNYSLENDICVDLNGVPFYGSYHNTPHLYGYEYHDNPHEYLKTIDSDLHRTLTVDCERHMYLMALDNISYFMDENDCYSKILPINKTINIESACGSPIDSINFIIQFVSQLQVEKQCKYSKCYKLQQQHNPIFYPLTKISSTRYVEGYWQEFNECGCCNKIIYPYPRPTDMQVSPIFLQNLEYVKKYSKIECFFGPSDCRLCGTSLGGNEFSFKTEGITYVFPDGIDHYYKEHGVQPSEEFSDAIEQYVAENTE